VTLQRYVGGGTKAPALTDEQAQEMVQKAMDAAASRFGAALRSADGSLAKEVESFLRRAVVSVAGEMGLRLGVRDEDALVRRAMDSLLGLGFLEELLPPRRTDISEIMINQDGSVWIMKKGQIYAERVDLRPSLVEVQTVVGRVLGFVGRGLTEAEPIVSARLPRTPRLPAGARVNVVGPPIANGPYPIVNIRLYEEKPVEPEQLLRWGLMHPAMLNFLKQAVKRHLRILISGGTATGKTTTLSALANFIPCQERVVLAEDPAEIFVNHPHVVSMEARPPSLEGKYGVEVGDLVTTAMRQSPRWLIVGEVRTGKAATWLLRAQMSDHPGLSTVHAESPPAAVDTFCLLALLDQGVKFQATKELFTRGVDLVVQIGFDPWGVRRVMEMAAVEPKLRGGDVRFATLFRFDPEESQVLVRDGEVVEDLPAWRKAKVNLEEVLARRTEVHPARRGGVPVKPRLIEG